MKEKTLLLHVAKKQNVEREDTSGHNTQSVNKLNATPYFAIVSTRIYVEFLKNERRKERDR